MNRRLTAIIEREGNGYVALCPELDIASQGKSVSEARDNLKEALELFFETASAAEVQRRLHKRIVLVGCAGEEEAPVNGEGYAGHEAGFVAG